MCCGRSAIAVRLAIIGDARIYTPEELAVIVADKNRASAFAGVVRRAEAAN